MPLSALLYKKQIKPLSMDKIFLQGIKYDEKSSFMQGAKLAPRLIRQINGNGSSNSFAENGVDTKDSRIIDQGDFDIEGYFDIEQVTRKHLQEGARILTLGGDHSITFPILKAYSDFHPAIDILQIDAHGDLYDEFEGDKYSHACPFARIMEGGFAAHLTQVGIRTLTQHQREQAERFQVDVHEMQDLDLSHLTAFETPLYISLDMDAFDPAFAPGVSHHEPGGLTAREVIDLIAGLPANVIGADIVEFNPKRDVNDLTAALAAKMMREILAKMLES